MQECRQGAQATSGIGVVARAKRLRRSCREAFAKGWKLETLTVVKLALPELLRKSLATTNAIE